MVFLITNGLLLTAVSIPNLNPIGLLIPILGLIVTIYWILCSWHNLNLIGKLTIGYRKLYPKNYIEEIVQDAMFNPGWRRPTNLIGAYLPITFFCIWVLIILYHLLNFGF